VWGWGEGDKPEIPAQIKFQLLAKSIPRHEVMLRPVIATLDICIFLYKKTSHQ